MGGPRGSSTALIERAAEPCGPVQAASVSPCWPRFRQVCSPPMAGSSSRGARALCHRAMEKAASRAQRAAARARQMALIERAGAGAGAGRKKVGGMGGGGVKTAGPGCAGAAAGR